MTAERWDSLVRRLEREAAERPRAYRRRVALLGALGYAVVLATLAVLAAAVAALVAVFASGEGTLALGQLVIALVVLLAIFARAVWVPVDRPEGIEIERSAAPRLFEVVDEVRERLGAPRVDHVLVDGQLNAALDQCPRLGPLGWYRNYLILGLPLLSTLTTEEAKGMIAHELGHAAGGHGRTADWAYRVRATWGRLLEALEERRHWATWPYKRFLRWYAPLFRAYSFPLARVQEYEADRAAATVVGARCAAKGLARGTIGARLYGEVLWPAVFEQVETLAEPPHGVLTGLAPRLRSAELDSRSSRWLEESLNVPTNTDNTHPSLSHRLTALGVEPHQVAAELLPAQNGAASENGGVPAEDPRARPSAAEELLGELEAPLLEHLDSEWRTEIAGEWVERHREARESRRRLEELNERAESDAELSDEELDERTALTASVRGWESTLPLLRDTIVRDPSHAPAHFKLGEGLLDSDDDSGLAHLDRAMELDDDAIPSACEIAVEYLERRGRPEDAARYRRRGDARVDLLSEASEERSAIGRFDRFDDHDLSDEALELLRSQLEAHDDVKRAYLGRKRVKRLASEFPLYVLAVYPPFRVSSDERAARLVARVAETVELPGEFFVAVSEGPGKPVARRVRRGGSEVYRA